MLTRDIINKISYYSTLSLVHTKVHTESTHKIVLWLVYDVLQDKPVYISYNSNPYWQHEQQFIETHKFLTHLRARLFWVSR